MLGNAYRRFVAFACARPRVAAALLALACLPALGLTARFFANVDAGLQELLPRTSPSVRALEQIHNRLGSQAHLTIIAQSPDADTNRRFIDTLGERLLRRRIPEARSIQIDVKKERTWLQDRAPLLVPADKFDELMREVDASVAKAKAVANPLFVDLDAEPAHQTAESRWTNLRARVERETATYDRFAHGYLETPDGKTIVALVWLAGSEVDMGPSTRLFAAVEEEVASIKSAFASVRVAYAGDVKNLLEEHDAILADLSLSSVLVFLMVSGLVIIYFRSPRSVLVVLLGVVPGLLFTFAIGSLLVGHLNSNTAFLGSIIAGNGVNYPLLFLAYFRARSRSEPLEDAMMAAAKNALPGTLGAAATASAAYAGLAVSNFRGFSQFGWLGGVGMLTTWALTFVAVPIAVALLKPPRQAEQSSAVQRGLERFFARRRSPYVAAIGFSFAALALAGAGVVRGQQTGIYEMHLDALRNRESLLSGSASWEAKMNELFGSWINPVVVMVDDPAKLEPAAKELRRALAGGPNEPPAVDRIETINQYRPSPAEQQRRLTVLASLRKKLDALPTDAVPPDARATIDRWLRPGQLETITLEQVPELLLQGFREVTGEVDRAVLLYPSIKIDYADGVNMTMLARKIEAARLPEGTIAGGAFLFMTEVLRLVRDESARVILVVCVLVAVVLLPFFFRQPRRILIVLATVTPVAFAAQAITLALGMKINMLNFAAVPITIGVGADYALNLLGAMSTLRIDARGACARMGGAILLCSLTTIVGYASLLVAQSGALRSFGWAAVLGEVMAVATVLLVLPAALPRLAQADSAVAAGQVVPEPGVRLADASRVFDADARTD